jgi:hypothetical protein
MSTGSSSGPTRADVYVSGSIYTTNASGGSVPHAAYWKNGAATQLSDMPSLANAIVVSGNDVYVAGTENSGNQDAAKYWKNGTTNARANAIFVSGSDVYVAGTVVATVGSSSIARYWKNGTAVDLTNSKENGEAPGRYLCRGTMCMLSGL